MLNDYSFINEDLVINISFKQYMGTNSVYRWNKVK